VKLRPTTPELTRGSWGLADFGKQKNLHIEDRMGGKDHQIGRLLPFITFGTAAAAIATSTRQRNS
jgi:hypothetical protein